jgi:hypothetical protein
MLYIHLMVISDCSHVSVGIFKAQGSLKKWYNPQPSLCDLKIQLAPEALSDAQEVC